MCIYKRHKKGRWRVNDDNSLIAVSKNTMNHFQLSRGDLVWVRGKKRKDTVVERTITMTEERALTQSFDETGVFTLAMSILRGCICECLLRA